ncbi:MAG TPA: TonB-dependent receptor, partial [Steroidobacteraceae bacterium]
MRAGILPSVDVSIAVTVSLLLWTNTVGAQTLTGADKDAAADRNGASALSEGSLQEVTVTATRREEDIQRVPISISAVTQEQMDVLGVRQITDLAKFTPGLFISGGQGTNNNFSIRGIAATSGAATTGIYIDDTPIQARNNGFVPGSALPSLFDLQRVEVLKGPQGTLFGAGSEGGTVRFVLTQPNLTQFTQYARAEGVGIENGGNGGEAGVALSGPIIDDKLGVLASVYYRKQPGYIDAVTGTYTVADPTGASHDKAVNFTPTGEYCPNANWHQIKGFRVAVKYVPTESLQISPSVIYQGTYSNTANNSFFLAASNMPRGRFNALVYPAGDPATNPALVAQYGPNLNQANEHFILPALQVQWSLGSVQMIYNGSYFHRDQYQWSDSETLYQTAFAPFPTGVTGEHANGYQPNRQNADVQELRFQSTDPQARISWVAGAFFDRDLQFANDLSSANYLSNLASYKGALADGPPFGPGSSAVANYYGYPFLQPNNIFFFNRYVDENTQVAGFAEGNLKITSKLTFTAGLRFSDFVYSYSAGFGGPQNTLNPTKGQTCAALGYGTNCSDNLATGVIPAPAFSGNSGSSRNTVTTPKVSLQYQLTPQDMVYATVSKGFRPASGSNLVPLQACGADLALVGYPPDGNQTTQPATVKPDYLWSYELGTKDRVGPVQIDASLYDIRWSNIQPSVRLPTCAYTIQVNAGHAQYKGADLSLKAKAFQTGNSSLLLGGNLSYNKVLFSQNDVTPGGTILFYADTGVPNAGPPLTESLLADYNLRLASTDLYEHFDWEHSS